GVKTVLLTGSLARAEAAEACRAAASGAARLVIGTHALVEERLRFARLGLVVIDEQHRFGVWQRLRLGAKASTGAAGGEAHLLVMTATPIPRSLAHALWGDLDLAVIDELPPGRRTATTRVFAPGRREQAMRALEQAVRPGAQGFVVPPR